MAFAKFTKLVIKKNVTTPINIATGIEKADKLVIARAKLLLIIEPISVVTKHVLLIQKQASSLLQ